jgi:phosphatidylinositol alpha 1,6-mannosyltransferase
VLHAASPFLLGAQGIAAANRLGVPSVAIFQNVTRELRGMPVTWLGRLGGADLAAAYASFDMFAHAGTEETFGQTVQEAHASGVPVVAPRAGGPIDLVRHGENGFLFAADDERELRDFAQQLVADAPSRRRMGEAGRRGVLDRSWETLCTELMEHYACVLPHENILTSRELGIPKRQHVMTRHRLEERDPRVFRFSSE